jgi:hypothetical protein
MGRVEKANLDKTDSQPSPFDKLPRQAPRQTGTGGAGRAGSSTGSQGTLHGRLHGRPGQAGQALRALQVIEDARERRRAMMCRALAQWMETFMGFQAVNISPSGWTTIRERKDALPQKLPVV